MKKIILVVLLMLSLVMTLVACEAEELTAPTTVTYDGVTLDWDDVSTAESYNVVINSGTAIPVYSSQYNYTNTAEQFTVSISSNRGDEVSLTLDYTFVKLGEVTNLVYEEANGRVTWDAVTNADQYIVKLNGESVATVGVAQFTSLVTGVNSIQVMPVCSTNSTYYGTWSETLSLELLSTPTNLSYSDSNNVISWDRVAGASSYKLTINDAIISTTSNSYTYELADGMYGDIVLAVQAVSNVENVYSSLYCSSETYTYLEPITGLTADNGEVFWDDIAPNGQYMVTITTTVNGTPSTTTKTVSTNSLSDLTPGVDYTVSVKALPANDHQFSSYSEAIKVYFLSTPTLTVSDVNDDQIGFAFTAGNSETYRIASYQLLILKNGVQVVNTVLASDATGYSTYTFEEVGEYTVSIKANAGNNEEDYEFDSKYSDAITVVRLGSISNLAVNEGTNTSSDYFTFSASSNATSSTTYNYSVGPYSGSVNTLSFDMPADDTADEQSYLVSVYAAGSGSTTVNGKYYLSSTVQTVAVTKLATPTSLTWTGDSKLSWTGVSSASNYTLSVGGVESTSNGTDLSYTFSQAGEYLIKVQASGSYNNFIIDSNYSDEITVTKLAAPELSVDGYGYLTWVSSFGQTVSGFTVSCSGSAVTTTTNEVSQFDINSYINTTAPTVISVVAVGAASTDDIHFYANSEPSSVYASKLASTTIAVNNTNSIISWDAVSNANTYNYTRTNSSGTPVEIKSTDATNMSTEADNFAAGSYTIAVYAESYKNSSTDVYYVQSETTSITVTKLESVVLDSESNTMYTSYSWSAILGSNGYLVDIYNRDAVHIEDGNGTSYTPAFTTAEYASSIKVTIYAFGDDDTNTITSDGLVITQTFSKLTKPTITSSYDEETGTIVYTSTESAHGGQYQFTVANISHTTDSNTYSYSASTAATYSATVKLLGSYFYNGVYYYDSDASTAVSCEVLKPVTNIVGYLSNGYFICSWTNASNSSVTVTVTVNGVEVTPYSTAIDGCTISNISAGDTIEVSVFVKGNGVDKISSAPTTKTFSISIIANKYRQSILLLFVF